MERLTLEEALPRLRANDSTLTDLNMRLREIGDEGAKELANAIKKNSTLTGLDLGNNSIRDEGAKALANAIKENSYLSELHLNHNIIGDEGAKALANAIKKNTSLSILNLNSNSIGVEGVKELENALEENSTLSVLHLDGNNIGYDGVEALDNALEENSTLTELYMGDNNIDTAKGVGGGDDDSDDDGDDSDDAIGDGDGDAQNFRSQRVFGDGAHGKDQLGLEHIAKALAEMLSYKNLEPPLTLAIEGKWGSGKSFIFNLIRQEFGKIQAVDLSGDDAPDNRAFVGHIYPIDFNVWTYSKGNLMASLMLTILTGLNKQLQYEQILGDEVLLKGVNLVKLMEGVSAEELQHRFENEEQRQMILELLLGVGKNGTLNVSEALLDAVAESREKDKKDLANAKTELVELEQQARMEYFERQNDKVCWCSADKKPWIKSSLKLGYSKKRKKEENDGGARNENVGVFLQEDDPIALMRSIGVIHGHVRLFLAGEMSWRDQVFFLVMVLISVALGLVVWTLGLRKQWMIGPAAIALIIVINAKLNDAYERVKTVYDEAKVEAMNEAEYRAQEDPEADRTLWNKMIEAKSKILTLEQSLWLKEGEPIASLVHDRLRASGYEKELGVVHKVHMDIQKISHSMLNNGSKSFPRGDPRVVLFVDDLDRCPPDKVVQMLEALQLLVKTKLFVVAVAIDARYVTLCLEDEYKGVLDPNGGDRPTGLEYLEKIIQIAYRIPPITEEEAVRKYIESQCPEGENAESQSQANDRQEESPRPDAKSQDQSRTLDPYTREQSRTSDSASQDQWTSDSEGQEQSQGVVGTPTKEERNTLNESNELFQQRAQLPLSSAEKNALVHISSEIQINPRALKRVVNSFKVIKIVCHRQGENFANENTRIALLVLLAMSASSILRSVVCRLLAKLESDMTVAGNLGSLFNETVWKSERNTILVDWIQEKLGEVGWSRENRMVVRQQIGLFRSFSFLGEFRDREKRRPFWVTFTRDKYSLCLTPDNVATCRTGAELFARGREVSRENKNITFAFSRDDMESLRNKTKTLSFVLKTSKMLKESKVVLSREQFTEIQIHNLFSVDGDSIEIELSLADVEKSCEKVQFIDLDSF